MLSVAMAEKYYYTIILYIDIAKAGFNRRYGVLNTPP